MAKSRKTRCSVTILWLENDFIIFDFGDDFAFIAVKAPEKTLIICYAGREKYLGDFLNRCEEVDNTICHEDRVWIQQRDFDKAKALAFGWNEASARKFWQLARSIFSEYVQLLAQ